MRVVGKHRKSKVEGPRVVGLGLMVAGSMALVLSVAGAAGAGSSKAAEPAHRTCSVVHTEDGPIAQILQWQGKTNCQQNTTTTTYNEQNTTTTHKKYPCGCSTTTTEAATTTTEAATTTTEVVTTPSQDVAGTTITLATTTAEGPTTTVAGLVGESTTTTEDTAPNNVVPQGGTSTTLFESPTGDTAGPVGQQITVSPETATLPFTGSNTMPLAGAGIVMVLTGFGLSRRKRRLAS